MQIVTDNDLRIKYCNTLENYLSFTLKGLAAIAFYSERIYRYNIWVYLAILTNNYDPRHSV